MRRAARCDTLQYSATGREGGTPGASAVPARITDAAQRTRTRTRTRSACHKLVRRFVIAAFLIHYPFYVPLPPSIRTLIRIIRTLIRIIRTLIRIIRTILRIIRTILRIVRTRTLAPSYDARALVTRRLATVGTQGVLTLHCRHPNER